MEAIFKDAMMTAAAIDRLVHHSVIIELNIPSYRVEHAKQRQQAKTRPRVREADRREATAQNRKGRELWKCGLWKAWKAKTGFPLFPRAPWKSRQKAARFPHFTAPATRADGKVENQSRFFHFPPPRMYMEIK